MFTAPDIKAKAAARGLTLLEVVVGMAILALMAGAIYAIVSGSVESTAALSQIQAEDRRVETFLDRCRDAFSHLPEGATIQLQLLQNEPMRQELTLRQVPEAFGWGEQLWWATPVVTLALQPWPDDQQQQAVTRFDPRGQSRDRPVPAERVSLAMTVPDFFKTDAEGEPDPNSPVKSRQGHALLRPDVQGRFWFDLLPEVESAEWRFYDPAKKLWVEHAPPGRPPMIELKLALPGRTEPLRAVFQTQL